MCEFGDPHLQYYLSLKARHLLCAHAAKVPILDARMVHGVFSIKYLFCKHSVSRGTLFGFCVMVMPDVGSCNMNHISVSNDNYYNMRRCMSVRRLFWLPS